MELDCHFFDANTVTTSSDVNGVHLDAEQHVALGLAIAKFVTRWMPPDVGRID
jgi:hypothetical protein